MKIRNCESLETTTQSSEQTKQQDFMCFATMSKPERCTSNETRCRTKQIFSLFTMNAYLGIYNTVHMFHRIKVS